MKNSVFPSEAINWEALECIGIYKDELEKSGELETLFNGEKTSPINLRIMFFGVDIDLDATLQLKQEHENCILEIKGISSELSI